MIDELDKITSEGRGDPAAALLEVLDPEQNSAFRDTYLGVPFDLSRVLFLATANVVEMIPDPLLDRLEVIALPGYIEEEKLHIATRYLIPRLRDAHGLAESHFSMTEDAVRRVIREYTLEAGVRELERRLATICRKAAKDVAMDFSCTFLVGPEEVLKFLGPSRIQIEMAGKTDRVGVATGLAWTAEGGDILFVEALRMPGTGELRLTGQVGDVMRESALASLSYIQSHAAEWRIPDERIRGSNFHIHLPGGAIPKDGPSAGVAMVLVIVSVLTNRPIHHDVAMTGEITLRGEVLPIGGVREKVLGAHRAGIRKVLLPSKNSDDLSDIPAEILGKMEFRFVERVDEVLSEALLGVVLPPGEESQDRGAPATLEGSKGDGRRPRARHPRVHRPRRHRAP
jgi:ATP-dependent Lon protease